MKQEEKKISPDKIGVSANKVKKEGLVAQYSERVEKSKGMIFANYQGLTHHQLEALKRAAKKADAEFVATKNTLLLRALGDRVTDAEKKYFEQPTATLFMYNDVVEPIKNLAKTVKELQLPKIKFGLIEGKVINDAEVVKLSTLPPVNVLRAQLLGQLQSPIAGLHRSLQWNIQKFVLTLKAIENKKA